MMSDKGNEVNLEYMDDQKRLNSRKETISLPMVSDSFEKETAIKAQSKELYFTLNYKGLNLRICKPLLHLKLTLLFWFAGSKGIVSFFPVFLKQRGLSVAHMSLVTAATAVIQLLGASLSGVIADKIGRAKPVLFAHITVTVLVSIMFLLLPPITSEATTHQFQLRDNNNLSVPRLIAGSWCNASTTLTQQETCKLYYFTDTSYNYNEEYCFLTNAVSQTTFVDDSTNAFENITVCFHKNESIMPSGTSYIFCKFTYCKLLEKECISKIQKCSKWDNKTILLFSVYAFLITMHYMSLSCVFRFLDVTAISLTAEHNADFGEQRVMAIVGSLIGPSLIGYALQVTSGNDKNYSLAFVFYILFTILTVFSSWNIKIRVREPGKKMWKKVVLLMKKLDNFAFIFVLLVLGTSFNFMVIYSNWYLEDLGASKLLLGLVTPLSSVFCLFSLYTSKWWIRNIGEHNIFIIALIGYAFYNISFSFLVEPWYSIPIGIVVYTFSYHLLWVAVVEYAHTLAPEGLYATVIVMAGVISYIISRVSASLIGGMIMDAYGGRIAFRVMGSIDFVTAVLYGIFRYFRHH